MEENILVKYLSKAPKQQEKASKEAGPVITISREYGCFAWKVGEKLREKINARNCREEEKWSLVTKEILEKAAEDLKTRPEKILSLINGKQTGFFEDLFSSFIKSFYISDAQIIQKIKEVIYDIAYEGNSIIVGRASNVIASEIKKSLHVKIIAPFDYRVLQISDFYKLPRNQAAEHVITNEGRRLAFLKIFVGDRSEYDYYDIVINHAKFDDDQIANIIYNLAVERGLIEDIKE